MLHAKLQPALCAGLTEKGQGLVVFALTAPKLNVVNLTELVSLALPKKQKPLNERLTCLAISDNKLY